MRYTLLILFTGFSFFGFSQKDKEQTLFFGVNIGTKLANKNYAWRYSGFYGYPGATQLESALYNEYNENIIKELLEGNNFTVPYDAYSQNIRYTPGLLTGVTIGYQVSPNLQMSVDGNFNKLKVRDVFSIKVLDGSVQTSQDQYRLGEIYAEESRFEGRYNVDYVYDGNKARFILGGSGLFSFWRMDQHIASFMGHNMSLYTVHSATPQNEFNITRGSGWGLGMNFGVEYRVNDKIVSQIMYQPYQTFVNYGIAIEKRFLPQHDITVRFLWK